MICTVSFAFADLDELQRLSLDGIEFQPLDQNTQSLNQKATRKPVTSTQPTQTIPEVVPEGVSLGDGRSTGKCPVQLHVLTSSQQNEKSNFIMSAFVQGQVGSLFISDLNGIMLAGIEFEQTESIEEKQEVSEFSAEDSSGSDSDSDNSSDSRSSDSDNSSDSRSSDSDNSSDSRSSEPSNTDSASETTPEGTNKLSEESSSPKIEQISEHIILQVCYCSWVPRSYLFLELYLYSCAKISGKESPGKLFQLESGEGGTIIRLTQVHQCQFCTVESHTDCRRS